MQAQKIAVLEFTAAKGISITEVDGISRMFMTYFKPAGWIMIDREKINQILSEQGLQRSDLTQKTSAEIGEILNVSKIVVGTVSKLGGKYQVDVSVDDVQGSNYSATAGDTFVGDYRTHVSNLATNLAAQIAVTSGSSVHPTASPSRKRTDVEILYGYLKIFPNELGKFQAEPKTVIAQINKQAKHGYNNWRIPSEEELSLMKANNYIGSGEYMSQENRKGIVLLVTDGKDYATLQAEEKAKKETEESIVSDDEPIFDVVEENAQFPGGGEAYKKWLQEHIKYPQSCSEQNIQGRVQVNFVVNRDGSIVDVKILRSPDPNLSKEAERLVKIMPKWKPAKIGDKIVRSRFNLPIVFRL